jgi:carboxypeptidase PM20D1
VVGDLSLLYTWQGQRSQGQTHHADGAPGRGAGAPGTEDNWAGRALRRHHPDGFVWGRGAWDDKGNLIAQMEAMEMLAASGFAAQAHHPLGFGADEEVAGERGAKRRSQRCSSSAACGWTSSSTRAC